MRGRRGWVLLLLAAVFAMHGLQCAAADAGPTAGMHGAHHAQWTDLDEVLPLATAGPLMASIDAVAHASPVLGGSAAPTVAPSPGDHDGAPHGSGHLWALCLAVLAAGLAVLLVLLAGRLSEVRLPRPRRGPGGPRGWLRRPRPPDLYSLCLMRI